MIFLTYILVGALLLAIVIARLVSRSRRPEDINAKTDFLNTFTLIHCSFYLVYTLYILIGVPLPVFALSNYLFIDPLAIYEVLITSVVFLLSAIYGKGYVRSLLDRGEVEAESIGLFYACFNLLLVIVAFSFFSNNLALFWILLELTTIISAVLIVMLSARENIIAALKYVFIASTAMLFSVIGLIILFNISKGTNTGSGTLNWTELMLGAKLLPAPVFIFAFAFMFIGFASKAGIAPFHTWLPQAHAKAPSMVSTVLSAALLNCGIYGVIRLYAIAHRIEATQSISIIMIVFGTISIAVAAFSMLPRSNIKKLIGFSSIEHMGLVLIGIGIGTPIAIFWTLFHIMAHSLSKSLLFFSAGILHHQFDSNRIQDMQNTLRLQPLASWGIIIGSIAVIGMPPFPIFLSKLFILTQLGNYCLPLVLLILLLLLIIAGAFAYLLIPAFTKQTDSKMPACVISWTMKLPIVLLFIGITITGIFCSPLFNNLLTKIISSLGF